VADDEAAEGRAAAAGADAEAGVVELMVRHRAAMLAATMATVVVLTAACTHVDASRWVTDARETVRYRYERMWLPIPDAVSGFTLRLSFDRDLLVPGTELTPPRPDVDAEVEVLRAPTYHSSQDLTGTIRITDREADLLVIRVDLSSPSLSWHHAGRLRFAGQ
jgi:hypothetical protein